MAERYRVVVEVGGDDPIEGLAQVRRLVELAREAGLRVVSYASEPRIERRKLAEHTRRGRRSPGRPGGG